MNPYDEIEQILNEKLQVYYTKKEDVNRERELKKQKTIKWLMSQYRLGPQPGGVLRSDRDLPDYCFWGSDLWEIHKAVIKIRDPMCRICMKNPTTEIHHIRPKHLKGSYYHPRNLIGLCTECHDEVHRRIDQGINDIIESSLSIQIADCQRTLDRWKKNDDGKEGSND